MIVSLHRNKLFVRPGNESSVPAKESAIEFFTGVNSFIINIQCI